jgi:hypothetical protein
MIIKKDPFFIMCNFIAKADKAFISTLLGCGGAKPANKKVSAGIHETKQKKYRPWPV